jgi:lipopolysaccharide biosynthesis regulator YciM
MDGASGTTIAVAVAVVVVAVGSLYLVFRRPPRRPREDRYSQALELWLAGDRTGAAELLRRLVADDPDAVDPYLQLGILLRELGDPARAAVIHRSLTVRPGLTREKRITVGLALADDLAALARWQEVETVLDELAPVAGQLPRFVWLRFAAFYERGDLPEAARTLKRESRRRDGQDRALFEQAYAAFQLDRALQHARAGETGAAQARLRDVDRLPAAKPRAAFVRALLAARNGDATAAGEAVTTGLLAAPEELTLYWTDLQEVLLETGQYDRTIPILESACRESAAPPNLWVALALLYEKLGRREQGVRLLAGKAGDPRLTPDVAAPFLRLLVADRDGESLRAVWAALAMPESRMRRRRWVCGSCGRDEAAVRWFCPECRSFAGYVPLPPERRQPALEGNETRPIRF